MLSSAYQCKLYNYVNEMYVILLQCSYIWALPIAKLWFSAPSWTRPTNHSTVAVKFLILQTKAYATALANLLKTIASSEEFQDSLSTLYQLLTFLCPFVRAPGGRSRFTATAAASVASKSMTTQLRR